MNILKNLLMLIIQAIRERMTQFLQTLHKRKYLEQSILIFIIWELIYILLIDFIYFGFKVKERVTFKIKLINIYRREDSPVNYRYGFTKKNITNNSICFLCK